MKMKSEWWLHRTAAFIGGFTGIYTVTARMNFANAQTLNLLEAVESLFGRNPAEFMIHFAGAVLYAGAIFAATILSRKSRINMRLFSMAVNICGFIVFALLPADMKIYASIYPAFIMMSVQWVVFGGLNGYNSSPIFSTNNLRQMSASFAEYLCDHKREHLDKAKYFGGTLIFFHTGAAAGYFAVKAMGTKAAYVGIVPCLIVSAIEISGLVCQRAKAENRI